MKCMFKGGTVIKPKLEIIFKLPIVAMTIGAIAGYLQYGDLIHMLAGIAIAVIGYIPVAIVSMIPIIGFFINIFWLIPLITTLTGFTHRLLVGYWTVMSLITNVIFTIIAAGLVIKNAR